MATSREYKFSGIDCVSCSQRLEDRLKQIEGITRANVNFSLCKLNVETDGTLSDADLEKRIQNAMEDTEKGSRLIVPEKSVEANRGKQNIENTGESISHRVRIAAYAGGILLYLIGLFLVSEPIVRLFIFIVVYGIFGTEVLTKSVKNILKGRVFDENFLMSIATFGAFIIGEYPEGAAVMIFYQIGEMFQDYAVDNSRRAIKSLLDIKPDYANIEVDGEYRKVDPATVSIGQTIIIRPGERVPLDGIVVKGSSYIDTSALTGESLPQEVTEGNEILSGSINTSGLIYVRVTKLFHDSTVNRILSLVENASGRKSTTERFMTKFAAIYTPAVVGIALLLATIPPVFFNQNLIDWVYKALLFLVLSCPCALVISIPLGFFGGIGAASKRGIMVKGGNYLEALAKVDTIVFDKTGTLTRGVFEVTEVSPVPGITKDELLYYISHAEIHSSHPLATSVKESYDRDIDSGNVSDYREYAGMGVSATVSGKKILCGNLKLMNKFNIDVQPIQGSGTTIHLAINRKYSGYIRLEDTLKEDAEKTIRYLHGIGLKNMVMLTGDHREAAAKTARILGIDNFESELLPHEKVECLERIIQEHQGKGTVAFVGDGINDSPVIARADVGIAMGAAGSDAAIEAADVVIMTDEPSKLIEAVKISRRTKTIVFQNIILAIGVKLLVLALGAGGVATLWEAVFADVGVAILAILNAMRLIRSE